MDRCTSKFIFHGKVSAMVWCDKKLIYFAASKYVDKPSQTVLRYDAEQHKRIPRADAQQQ